MARPRRRLEPWVAWPAVITASGVATLLMAALDGPDPLRRVVTIWFLLVCPGMAFARLLGVLDPVVEWALAVGLSLTLSTVVSEAMLWVGWSTLGGLVILAILAAVGCALVVRRGLARERAVGLDLAERTRAGATSHQDSAPVTRRRT